MGYRLRLGMESILRRVRGWRRRSDRGGINLRGPVFLSYRHSDGSLLATNLAWALRAAGVPVWHDKSDLPPGDTRSRLDEALRSGLSGAVLLVTPEIGESSVIRDVELQGLLALEANGAFTLSIASTIETAPGRLDYAASDQLLSLAGGTLSRLHHDPALTPRDLADIARGQCRQRMEALRADIESAGRVIHINMQTRIDPSASGLRGDLVVRLRKPMPGDRRPNRQGLEDLQMFLADLPHLVEISGARHGSVSGGAHLSVAFALGAALPTTLLGHVEAVDTAGYTWTFPDNAPAPVGSTRLLEITDRSPREAISGDALVYVDLLPTRSDAAFEQFLEVSFGRFAGVFHIRTATGGNLRPGDASAVVAEASQAIRQAASLSEVSEVHLLLRCPWTVALLLGRTLNTIRVHLYEWEDGLDDDGNLVEPRYLPSLVVRSGTGESPIESVAMPARAEA